MEGLIDAKVEVRGCLRRFLFIGRIIGNSVERLRGNNILGQDGHIYIKLHDR